MIVVLVYFFFYVNLLLAFCVQSAVYQFRGYCVWLSKCFLVRLIIYSGIHHTYVAGLCFFFVLLLGFGVADFERCQEDRGLLRRRGYCGGEGVGGSGTLFSSSIRCLLLRFFFLIRGSNL